MAPELSVIKFPEGILSSEERSKLTTDVVRALENPGCFVAEYKTLLGCHEKLFSDPSKKIFDLPVETKKQNVSDILEIAYKKDPDLHRLYERFGIREATTREDMRQAILGYTRTAAELEEMVRKMVFEHYKVKLPDQESTGYIFRMMKNKEVRLGCSDEEFLAVLDLNQNNSLEIETNVGHRFSIKPSTFLVMAGKPLMEWSKDKIRPLEHRVTKHGEKEKYSVGLFAYYDKGKIEVPKKLAGSSTPSYDDKKGKDEKKPVGSSCPP